MKLPGLDFNPMIYATYDAQITDGDYRMIPFSDWWPSDFEDVLCSRGGALKKMYFSPSTLMMVPSDTENGGWAISPSDLLFWLKKV